MSRPRAGSASCCATCGAPIDTPEGEKCSYCGVRWPRKTSHVVSAVQQPAAAPYGRRFIKLYMLMVAGSMVVSFIIWAVTALKSTPATPPVSSRPRPPRSSAPPERPALRVSDVFAVLPSAGGEELLCQVYESNRYVLMLVGSDDQTVRWRSEPLNSLNREHILLGEKLIYVFDGERLLGLRRDTGATAWQVSLTAELTWNAKQSIALMKQRVIALQKDGSLQAFDATTGEQAWSRRFANRPDRIIAAGELLAIKQQVGKRAWWQGILLLNPVDGTDVRVFEPTCRRFPFTEHPSSSDPVLFSADGGTMFSVFGSAVRCAQRFDVATGKSSWLTILKRSSSSGPAPVLSDEAIVGANGTVLTAIDRETGRERVVLEDSEQRLELMGVRDGVAVLKAAPQWDSSKRVLWGVDMAKGSHLWTHKPMDVPDFHGASDSWAAVLTPQGITVAQVNPPQLAIDVLDWKTGVSAGRKSVPIEVPKSPLPVARSFGGPTLLDGFAWLRVAGDTFGVDLAAGKVRHTLR